MANNDSDKNQDSRTQILLALVGLVGTLGVALITNWEKFEKWLISSQAPVSIASSLPSPSPELSKPLSPSPEPSNLPTSPSPLVPISPSVSSTPQPGSTKPSINRSSSISKSPTASPSKEFLLKIGSYKGTFEAGKGIPYPISGEFFIKVNDANSSDKVQANVCTIFTGKDGNSQGSTGTLTGLIDQNGKVEELVGTLTSKSYGVYKMVIKIASGRFTSNEVIKGEYILTPQSNPSNLEYAEFSVTFDSNPYCR